MISRGNGKQGLAPSSGEGRLWTWTPPLPSTVQAGCTPQAGCMPPATAAHRGGVFHPRRDVFLAAREHLLTQLPHCSSPGAEGGEIQAGWERTVGLHTSQWAQAQAGFLSSKSPNPQCNISSPPLPTAPLLSPIPLWSQKDFCSLLSLLSQLPAPALPPSASHPDSAGWRGRNVNRLQAASCPVHHPCCMAEMLPRLWGLPCGRDPRTHPCSVWVTLTFPLGAMASQAGNHQSEGEEELREGTEKPT